MLRINNDLLNFKRPSDHSTFSPSSTDRWTMCPFSIKATEGIPNESSVYSEEGSTAHSVCEAVFAEEFYGVPFPSTLNMEMLKYDGEEMLRCAHTYVDTIAHWLKNETEIGDVLYYGLERGIPIFPDVGCFGTADCLIIGTRGCAIIDYKHGQGKNVSADSSQLRSYAAGVLRHIENIPEDYAFFSIVVQPRTDIAPKVARFTFDEIYEHSRAIKNAITASKRNDLEPVEGSHCFFCPARRTKDPAKKCPAIAGKALKLANEDFNKFLTDMNAPIEEFGAKNVKRDEALIKIISLLPMLQQVAKDGEAEFLYRMEQGEAIPGLQIVEKLGNRSWVFDNEDSMKSALSVRWPDKDFMKVKTSLMTITEVEKIVGKNKTDGLTMRKLSKKLVVQDKKIQDVLGELAAYGNLISSNNEAEG